MLEAMDNYLMVESNELEPESSDDKTEEDDEIDPRWAELKKLKKNK